MADVFGVDNGVVVGNRFAIPAGPKLDSDGLDMHSQDIVAVKNVVFSDPSIDHLNQSAARSGDAGSALVIDKLAATDRKNVMSRGASVECADVDATYAKALKLPTLWSPNTLPTLTGNDAGFMIYDASNQALKVWTGSEWKSVSLA